MERKIMVIKIALVLYVFFAGFIVWFLWTNSEAPNSLQNTGIMFASIIPILILVSPLLTSEKLEKVFIYTLFFDYEKKEVTSGQVLNKYQRSYFPMFANISTSLESEPNSRDDLTELFNTKGIDMIEKGVLETFIRKFGFHWDIEPREFKGPLFTSTQWSNNSNTGKTTMSIGQLRKIFKHNQMVSAPGVLVGSGLCIPPGSLRVVCGENSLSQTRTLIFKNSHTCLKIKIINYDGGVAQQGISGIFSPDHEKPNRYWAQTYKVSVSMDLKKTKVYSPNMKAYRRWFANISDSLSVYDWQVIKKKIDAGAAN